MPAALSDARLLEHIFGGDTNVKRHCIDLLFFPFALTVRGKPEGEEHWNRTCVFHLLHPVALAPGLHPEG